MAYAHGAVAALFLFYQPVFTLAALIAGGFAVRARAAEFRLRQYHDQTVLQKRCRSLAYKLRADVEALKENIRWQTNSPLSASFDPKRNICALALQGAQRKFMGSQRPKMAFLAVFVALKIAHRAGGYTG